MQPWEINVMLILAFIGALAFMKAIMNIVKPHEPKERRRPKEYKFGG